MVAVVLLVLVGAACAKKRQRDPSLLVTPDGIYAKDIGNNDL